jgi:hypothetical protein
MKILEAREALVATIEDISNSARALGLTVNSDCYFSDRDLFVIEDEKADEAAVIAAEIELKYNDEYEKIFLECAVAINDGEVLSDDLTSECAKLRESIKEILDSISDSPDKKDAFVSLCHKDDEPEPERPAPQNNKYYYVSAAVGAVVILLLVLLINKLFG